MLLVRDIDCDPFAVGSEVHVYPGPPRVVRMADGLNDAIADAAREAARQAAREVVAELLANPSVRDLLRTAIAPKPTLTWRERIRVRMKALTVRLRECWGKIRSEVRRLAGVVRQRLAPVRDRVRKATGVVSPAWLAVRLLIGQVRQSPRSAVVAGAVGVGAGTAGYAAGPVAESVILGSLVAVVTLVGTALAPLFGPVRSARVSA